VDEFTRQLHEFAQEGRGNYPRFINTVKGWGPQQPSVTGSYPQRAAITIAVQRTHVDLDLAISTNILEGRSVILIRFLEASPMGTGAGSVVMTRLCDLADSLHCTMVLESFEPKHHGKRIPDSKLEAFYRRFGFRRETSDEHGSAYMFRRVK
jgi:GNAT superfamily N-acetyltransferase